MVLPDRATFDDNAWSAALDGPAGWLLLEEPHPERLALFEEVEDRLPHPEELLPPQLLPEEEPRDDPQLPPEELNDERPPEKLPPPPLAKLSPEGQTMASERRNAARNRRLRLDERDIKGNRQAVSDW